MGAYESLKTHKNRQIANFNKQTANIKGFILIHFLLFMIHLSFQIMRLQPFDLRRRLFITFRGEEGLDYGGVARSVCSLAYAVVCVNLLRHVEV